MDGGADWRERRAAAFAVHAAALERQRAAEAGQARALLLSFVAEMAARGVSPVRLRARVPDGRLTYRTGLTGWYLRRNGSLAVGVDGEFYLLETRRSLRSLLLGARVRPSDPPLRVGVGARDGESVPLGKLLRQRADAGHHWD